jgi:hypothetical protein
MRPESSYVNMIITALMFCDTAPLLQCSSATWAVVCEEDSSGLQLVRVVWSCSSLLSAQQLKVWLTVPFNMNIDVHDTFSVLFYNLGALQLIGVTKHKYLYDIYHMNLLQLYVL